LKARHLIVGLGCTAGAGKDTAFKGFQSAGLPVIRASSGDILRRDLEPLLRPHGIDPWSEERASKDMIRPLVVAYAELLKAKHGKLYLFTSALETALAKVQPGSIIVFTDIRFPFEVDELRRLGGGYIHIQTDIPPANDLERACEPVMAKMTGYVVRNDFDPNFKVRMLEAVQALITRFKGGVE
jgi:hypothetical protein